ncbi:outer membrane protein assembly factor [Candidatus Latescibacterota bacterium]
MRRRTYIIILSILTAWCALCAVNGAAQTDSSRGTLSFRERENTVIDSVIITVNGPLAEDVLRGIILSEPGGILNDGLIGHDVDALTGHYQKAGWWNARAEASVDSAGGSPVVLTYTITPGQPAIFGEITYNSAGGIPEFLKLPDVPEAEFYGQPLKDSMLEQIVQQVVSHYTASGYPDVVLRPSLIAHGDTVHVDVLIEPGLRAAVDSIAVYGLSRTKDYVVRREIEHLLGRDAGQEVVIAAKNAVGKIGFLRLAGDPYFDYSRDSMCMLVVNIEEGAQGSFDGAVGYQPSSDNASGEIVGKIDLAFPNIKGTGRASYIRWENLGENTEDLALNYIEPRILGSKYNISGSFAQEQRDARDYTKTIIQSSISRDIGRLTANSGYRYEKVSSDSLNSSSAHGIDAGITWNSIDNPANPGSGILYALRWSNVSKEYRFGTKGSHSLDRLEFDLDHYIPTFSMQTVALLLRYRRVETPADKLTLSDRYWLGGTSSIRGYREKIFPAVKAFWVTMEYRLIQGKASWIFVFIDSGYFSNKITEPDGTLKKQTISRTGYGFGLRIESRAGTLGFDFGLGQGDGFSEGKFHVGLANSF